MPRYIDADALKAKYEQMIPEIGDGYHKETLQDVLFELDYAPTVSPDDVRGVGKWTRHVLKNANTPWGYDCSACGEWFIIGDDTAERYNYCPNCGAKMEVSEDA